MKRFRNQHSKNCPEKRNLAMITNGKDHTYCLRSLDRFSCGIILCCVAAIALAGCPDDDNSKYYHYAPPETECDDGPTDPGTPKGYCKYEGNKCGGCALARTSYGFAYPCRRVVSEGEIGEIVDAENCSGENPRACTVKVYVARELDCDSYSWSKDVCQSRGCKFTLWATE